MKKMLSILLALCCLLALAVPAFAEDSLVIAIDNDIDTLHFTDYSTTVELDTLNQLYDTLLYIDPDGTKDPEPRIAESYEISDDGLTYTFCLRKDVTFHDGTPLTAEDVVFSLETYYASEYQGSQISMMSSVVAADDYTVVCTLETPYAPFLAAVCSGHIACKAYCEANPDTFATQPNGSGPYKFVSRANGSNIVLEAYEGYYRGAASIKNLTFEVIPDTATKAIALQTGEIGFADMESSVLAQLEANPAITVQEVATSAFTYVCMNTETAPFDNVLVRQAVNYAINRENVVAVCYDGKADVNSNICAKTRNGYREEQLQYTYDVEKAKALLAEAGIETPYNLGNLLIAEKYENIATVLQADLAAVGLNCTIVTEEFNTYIGDLTSGNFVLSALEMTLEGDTQMLEMAFITDYIGMANNARYSDAEMDDLFTQARVETDSEKRSEIFNTIFTKAQEEAIYASICNKLMLFAYSSDLDCGTIPFEGSYLVYDFSWKN